MHRHTVPFVPFSTCRLLNVGHQCATCRTLPSMPRGVATVHRHTANSSTVTRRKVPSTDHRHTVNSSTVTRHPSMHPSIHPSICDVTAGLWPVSTAAAGGPRTTSSHGCGLYRHTAAGNIATRCANISPHGGIRHAHISPHATHIYRHMV